MKNISILKKYNLSELTISTLGSHSALEICRGAKNQGFKTLVVTQKGREKTYQKYYKTSKNLGCVDQCLVLEKFSDILKPEIQKKLISQNALFIPHRSFEVYLNFDYQSIENQFNIPIFGNKYLLKIEERSLKPNQYDLLKSAGIRLPRIFSSPQEIDRLSIVKVLEKKRGFERAFFLVNNYHQYRKLTEEKIKQGVFTKEELKESVIEEFVLGSQVNFNFFYSPITNRLELLGTDTRRQTNIEGILRLPSFWQKEVLNKVPIKYEEAGHIAATVLESILEKAFQIGERFVKTSQKMFPPGVIGPFALQSIITPGPPKKEIVVVDVSPRVPGSPGISATPYSQYLYNRPMTVGERIGMEIKMANNDNLLNKIIT